MPIHFTFCDIYIYIYIYIYIPLLVMSLNVSSFLSFQGKPYTVILTTGYFFVYNFFCVSTTQNNIPAKNCILLTF
jgi:type III secretory pathway component EscV